jgi:hypothetical protein
VDPRQNQPLSGDGFLYHVDRVANLHYGFPMTPQTEWMPVSVFMAAWRKIVQQIHQVMITDSITHNKSNMNYFGNNTMIQSSKSKA